MEYFFYRTEFFHIVLENNKAWPWEKKEAKAFWRGGTTGGPYYDQPWDAAPRSQLIVFSKTFPEDLDAAFVQGSFYLKSPTKDYVLSYKLLSIPVSPGCVEKFG